MTRRYLFTMFLTTSNLIHHLLSRGLLLTSDVVNSRLMIWDAARRNRNFKVMINEDRGVFVKQIQTTDVLSVKTIQREIDFYQLAREFPRWSALMPKMIDCDVKRRSIVLELFLRAENLREYHTRAQAFPLDVSKSVGTVLGEFHRSVSLRDLTREQIDFFRKKPCWILSFKEAPASASSGVKQLLQFLHQHPELLGILDDMLANWKFEHVIHGDFKWDNCLVFPSEDGCAQVKMIDWELVDIGDVAWDVGGILQSYFAHWIGLPHFRQALNDGGETLEVLLQSKGFFLAIRAFWRAYADTVNLDPSVRYVQLLCSIRHAAARLILTVYESSWRHEQLTETSILMLSLSKSMLMSPELFGKEIHDVDESVAI